MMDAELAKQSASDDGRVAINDFFVPPRRGAAAKQDAICRFKAIPREDPSTEARYALTPAGEALLKEWEAARVSRLGDAR
jgi:hypothetical protein